MDLYAFSQIEELEHIAKKNKIEIPRCRGYRLMSRENFVSKEDIEKAIEDIKGNIYINACTSAPIRFRPNSLQFEYSEATDKLRNKYCIEIPEEWIDGNNITHTYSKVIGFRWDLIHGSNKKAIKLAIKQKKQKIINQLETFNKYVGRTNVLCIHARIGGGNWNYYGGAEIGNQSWFLEKVDDYFDPTYCDIYVKIEDEKNGDIMI